MAKASCTTCGQPHPKCNGHSKSRGGAPCGNSPVAGGVCRIHGGAAPQVIEAQERRDAEAEARALVETMLGHHHVLEHDDPLDGLLDEIARSGAAVAFYAARVRELRLDPESIDEEAARMVAAEADGNLHSEPPGKILELTMFGPVPNLWVKLWTEERMRHARLCDVGIRAGLAERQVRVAEGVAGRVAAAVIEALDDPEVGLEPAMRSKLRVVVGGKLRALASTPAA